MQVKVMIYNIGNYAIRYIKYITSYLIAITMFALFVIIYEIFANQIKCQKFDLENEDKGEGEKRDRCHLTDNV